MVDAGELCAVAGDVPLKDFAEEPLRAHLEDLRRLEEAARAQGSRWRVQLQLRVCGGQLMASDEGLLPTVF